jgi:hypothetical protein
VPELRQDGEVRAREEDTPEGARLADQIGFMNRSRLVIFGWLILTMGIAAVGPLDTDTMGWLLIAVAASAIPPVAFGVAWRRSEAFRERMLRLDLGALVLLTTARISGLAFLVLYAEDQLAGEFAFWAGGADLFTGLSAVTVAYLVTAMRPFPKRLFIGWNLFGIFDVIVGWALVVLYSPTAAGVLAGDAPAATTESVLQFPMSFILMFGVPLMVCVHAIVLLQIRSQREPRLHPLFHPKEEVAEASATPTPTAPSPVAR